MGAVPSKLERSTLTNASDPILKRGVREHGIREGGRIYLERLRWPDGPCCPRCDSTRILWLQARRKYHCAACKYQFRVTAGTRMHLSHLPGWKWLIGIELMMNAPDGLPATQLQEVLGGSYKTAWFLEHRIRTALPPADAADVESLTPGRAHHLTGRGYRNAYIAEASWRAVRRNPTNRFRATVHALLEAEPLGWDQLVEPRRYSTRL
jgi:transposase-like protein